MWTCDKLMCVDIAKAECLYPNRTKSKVDDGKAWEVRAKVSSGETITDEDYLLARTETLEGSRAYIDKLTACITSNMRDTDGRPMIIKTVSPEAFRIMEQKVEILQTIVELWEARLNNIERDIEYLKTNMEEMMEG